MTASWNIAIADEADTARLAQLIAIGLAPGDVVALRGGLGAGKTTFARSLIRAVTGNDTEEVPSPTFTLVQVYETQRFEIRHFDLYRLTSADELDELGFDDGETDAVTIVEWPERAGDLLPDDRFDISFSEVAEDAHARTVALAGSGGAAARVDRLREIRQFLDMALREDERAGLRIAYLQGDASQRRYARLFTASRTSLLMDHPSQPDGPPVHDGKSYSQIAHLAEDGVPFVAIARELAKAGLEVPEIHAFDPERGLSLIGDLGDAVFGDVLQRGGDQALLWRTAVDVLVHLRNHQPPAIADQDDLAHPMPAYDADVMYAEIDLLCDWYWPFAANRQMSARERQAFHDCWQQLIADVATHQANPDTRAWVLRDYHSPNLIWQSNATGIERVGIIDFQDAQIGHAAYDLVSLLQDARLDVSRTLHDELLDYYCSRLQSLDPAFEDVAFRRAYAILGAQRNTKILGIFARLSMRDSKHGYLGHLPRIRSYLAWNFEHDALSPVTDWFAHHLPAVTTR